MPKTILEFEFYINDLKSELTEIAEETKNNDIYQTIIFSLNDVKKFGLKLQLENIELTKKIEKLKIFVMDTF